MFVWWWKFSFHFFVHFKFSLPTESECKSLHGVCLHIFVWCCEWDIMLARAKIMCLIIVLLNLMYVCTIQSNMLCYEFDARQIWIVCWAWAISHCNLIQFWIESFVFVRVLFAIISLVIAMIILNHANSNWIS